MKLGDVLTLITYGLTVRPEYFDLGIPLISAREIRNGYVDLSDAPKISESDFLNLSNKSKPKKGDILFSKTGSIGHCAEVTSNEPFAITQNTARLSFKEERVFTGYIIYYLRSRYIQDLANREAKGNAVKDLQLGVIEEFPILLPPLVEQKRIAAIAQKADRLRRTRRYALQLSDTYLQSVFLEMFGNPVTNPKGWEIIKLGEALNLITYGLTVRPEYTKFGISLISAGEIRNGDIDFLNAPLISESDFSQYSGQFYPQRRSHWAGRALTRMTIIHK